MQYDGHRVKTATNVQRSLKEGSPVAANVRDLRRKWLIWWTESDTRPIYDEDMKSAKR